MNKAYIICFDNIGLLESFSYNNFHNKLTTATGILNWWHYLENVYIVITPTSIDATSISNYLMEIMPKKHFFVSELNLKNHNGFLPKEAWDWINTVNATNLY